MPIVPAPDTHEHDSGTLFGTQISTRRDPPAEALKSHASTPRGPNPLVAEADELLALVPQLRSTAQIADLAQLRSRIAALLQHFDERLRKRRVVSGQAQKAHFVLCALFDEVVETMPWGAGGRWEQLNPLKAAVGQAPGGATVRMFAQLAEDRSSSGHLRELIYMALALGFDARGRGAATGGVDADRARARLAEALKRKSDQGPQSLSVRWMPAVGRTSAFGSWLPLWVGTCIVGALLAALYFGLAMALGSQSDRVFTQIATLQLPVPAIATAAAAPAPLRLAPLLSSSAAPGLQVRDEMDRSVVTVSDETLFEPGTANLLQAGADALRPIAAALQGVAGRIQVVGHTDRDFEPSARFPSNWELSVEQARAVHDTLAQYGIAPSRMRYDGRADTEPPSAAGAEHAAAHGGRVEIVLLAGR
jgi:type VI secretion system protein ImpK